MKKTKTKKVDVEKLRDKTVDMKELFWSVIKVMKKPKDLTKQEIRALIIRVGYLDDKEREFYKSILIRKNLTDKDIDRYSKLQLLDRYFPEGV